MKAVAFLLLILFYDFMVFNVIRICILFNINDVRQYPLNSPGEMSSRFLLFSIILYTTRELHALNIFVNIICLLLTPRVRDVELCQ